MHGVRGLGLKDITDEFDDAGGRDLRCDPKSKKAKLATEFNGHFTKSEQRGLGDACRDAMQKNAENSCLVIKKQGNLYQVSIRYNGLEATRFVSDNENDSVKKAILEASRAIKDDSGHNIGGLKLASFGEGLQVTVIVGTLEAMELVDVVTAENLNKAIELALTEIKEGRGYETGLVGRERPKFKKGAERVVVGMRPPAAT